MVREETRALYDSFPPEDKSMFFAGYLYLKYTKHFYYYSLKLQGVDAKPPEEEIDEGIAEMLQMLCQAIAEGAMSHDTSLYHGKVMKKDDVRKLLTLDVDIDITPSERVMPFKIARQLLIESPGAIAAAPCTCRLFSDSQFSPCFCALAITSNDPSGSVSIWRLLILPTTLPGAVFPSGTGSPNMPAVAMNPT
jgi:hypothetical protein